MTTCTCGFHGNYGEVWAHCMNAKDAHVHKIETESVVDKTQGYFKHDDLLICDKCGTILGIRADWEETK